MFPHFTSWNKILVYDNNSNGNYHDDSNINNDSSGNNRDGNDNNNGRDDHDKYSNKNISFLKISIIENHLQGFFIVTSNDI